jgi:hypothetical protein
MMSDKDEKSGEAVAAGHLVQTVADAVHNSENMLEELT